MRPAIKSISPLAKTGLLGTAVLLVAVAAVGCWAAGNAPAGEEPVMAASPSRTATEIPAELETATFAMG